MRKLAIVLSSIVLLFGAGCASNSNKSDTWSASQKAELRQGLVTGYESTSGQTPSAEMTDCMTGYVTSHYSYQAVVTMSSDKLVDVGINTAKFCFNKQGITG